MSDDFQPEAAEFRRMDKKHLVVDEIWRPEQSSETKERLEKMRKESRKPSRWLSEEEMRKLSSGASDQ